LKENYREAQWQKPVQEREEEKLGETIGMRDWLAVGDRGQAVVLGFYLQSYWHRKLRERSPLESQIRKERDNGSTRIREGL